ncbi:MAG: tetratricopeptide repeat protein [Planctomycetota bacterium]
MPETAQSPQLGQSPPAPTPAPTETGLLEVLAQEPALLEVAVVMFVVGLFWLVMWRASQIAETARSRAALEDYLLGVEQALAGDLAGAAKRLRRVLKEAPENQPARLLYGEVLAELGEPAQAHKHHLELQRAFRLESPRNDMARARSLLAAGHPEQAVEPAAAAARLLPDSVAAWRHLFQAQMALGTAAEAGRTGARLARLLPPGAERDQVRQAAAAALARAGEVSLRRQDLDQARALCSEAGALDPDVTEVRMLEARVGLVAGGPEAVGRLLGHGRRPRLGTPEAGTSLVPITAGKSALPAQVVAPLAALLPSHAYRCSHCLCGLVTAVAVCPHCGSEKAPALAEPGMHREVESPSILMDAVEENEAHVRRLLEALEHGGEVARDAHDALLELGENAVEDILLTGVRRSTAQAHVVEVLRDMGARILPALFGAYRSLKERRILGIPGLRLYRSPVDVVRQVVQGYGEDAKSWFEKLIDTEDRDLRKVLVDYYLSLGDQDEFKKVLERFPPVEVIHRMNDAEPALLQPLLRTVARGSFLAEGLLSNTIFHRDLDLLQAMRDADDPMVLEHIIARRGANRQITVALIHVLDDDELKVAGGRLLDGFGMAAMGEMIAEFADLDAPAAIRQDLATRIARTGGAHAVERLCDCLGPSASALDGEILTLLARIGTKALTSLAEAYQQGSLLEKLGGSLIRRYSHRRTTILRAMQRIGGGEAIQQLTRLHDQETDPDLQLRIHQMLHELSHEQPEQKDEQKHEQPDRPVTGEGEDHGQAG